MSPGIKPPEVLKRIPGLYRRWELPDVLEAHRSYQIEEAGCHVDGTPLLAVYGNHDAPSHPTALATPNTESLTERDLAKRWRLSPRSLQRWRFAGIGPVYLKLNGRIIYRIADIHQYEERMLRQGTAQPAGSTTERSWRCLP